MASGSPQLDTTIEIVTPENIAFHYKIAGPFRRLPALLFDMTLKAALLMVLGIGGMMVLGLMEATFPGLRPLIETLFASYLAFLMVSLFVLNWFYGSFLEAYWNGQTPGKRMLGIRVLTVQGQPINGMQATLRNVLREVDLFVPIVGLSAMGLSRRFQRLGDLVAGTIVVIEDRQWLTGVIRLEDARAAELAAYIPSDFVISRTLAKAVSGYVDRRRFFNTARRREIARHLGEPLVRQLALPGDTSHDLLLCALYHRAFIADLA